MSHLLFVETNPTDDSFNWTIDESENVLNYLQNLTNSNENYMKTINEFVENGKDGEFFLMCGYGLLVKIKDRYFTKEELRTREEDIKKQRNSDMFVKFVSDILNPK